MTDQDQMELANFRQQLVYIAQQNPDFIRWIAKITGCPVDPTVAPHMAIADFMHQFQALQTTCSNLGVMLMRLVPIVNQLQGASKMLNLTNLNLPVQSDQVALPQTGAVTDFAPILQQLIDIANGLKTQVTNLTSANSQLQSQLTAANQQVSTLQGQVTSLNQQITTLQGQLQYVVTPQAFTLLQNLNTVVNNLQAP